MGLGNNASGGTWLQIKEGKFQLKTGDNTFTEYNCLSGKITNLYVAEKEWEGETYKVVNITVADEGGRYNFGVNLGSGLGRATLYKICNANLAEEMEFVPNTERDNPKHQSMFIKQFGVNVKNKWTKDNPGDMPPLETATVGKKTVYDSSAQEEYLIKYLEEHVIPKVKQNKVETTAPQPAYTSSSSDNDEIDGGTSEEIPF